ncbi:hypothetical protein HC928_20085 [bacterium]|nr:hypothetical protein [bacterium]
MSEPTQPTPEMLLQEAADVAAQGRIEEAIAMYFEVARNREYEDRAIAAINQLREQQRSANTPSSAAADGKPSDTTVAATSVTQTPPTDNGTAAPAQPEVFPSSEPQESLQTDVDDSGSTQEQMLAADTRRLSEQAQRLLRTPTKENYKRAIANYKQLLAYSGLSDQEGELFRQRLKNAYEQYLQVFGELLLPRSSSAT